MISRFAPVHVVLGVIPLVLCCQTQLDEQWSRSSLASGLDSSAAGHDAPTSHVASGSPTLNELPPPAPPPSSSLSTCDGGSCATPPNVTIDDCPRGSCANQDCAPGTQAGDSGCTPCEPGEYCAGGAALAFTCPGNSWDHDADPATACAAHSVCSPGTRIAAAGDARSDVECVPCEPGTFSSNDGALECEAWRTCGPGSFLASPGTATSDALCEGCASGSFSDAPGARECQTWTSCEAGEFVAEAGDASRDRRCASCPAGTYSEATNAGACVETDQCPPGTVQRIAATESSIAQCDACDPGSYCAGAEHDPVPCAAGTWDDDADPATPCVERSVCEPGYYAAEAGSATEDRRCAACPAGTFTDTPNAAECETWRSCAAGSYVQSAGSSTRDRRCDACPEGHYSDSINASSCTAWTTCVAPAQYVGRTPTAARDRRCAACEPPALTREDNAESCVIPAYRMIGGLVAIEAEHYHFHTNQGASDSWYPVYLPGVSNNSCVELGPDDHDLHTWTNDVARTAPRLDYYVDFNEAGNFYLFLRGDAGVTSHGTSNSCHGGLDDEPFSDYFDFPQQNNQWHWVSQPFTVQSPGIHRVHVWGREDGFRLDKIVVQRSATPPWGLGPPESPTH